MLAFTRQSLTRLLPVYGALAVALIAAAAFLVMSDAPLEAIVWKSGIAGVVPMAAPPLGLTARTILALGAGIVLGAVMWSTLYLVVGPGGIFLQPSRREDGVPIVRRADAHPDAPPRRPLSAADLGAPLMGAAPAVGDEDRTIPADLDLPLAAFDPQALLPVPMEAARPVAPLAAVAIASEWIETFELIPPVRPTRAASEQREVSAQPQTIEMLLRRLEEGAGRRREATAR